jgi:hypothetical protein
MTTTQCIHRLVAIVLQLLRAATEVKQQLKAATTRTLISILVQMVMQVEVEI